MTPLLPLALFPVIAVLVLYLFVRGDVFHLLVLSVVAGVIPGHWHLAGLRFDPTDVALIGLLLSLLVRTNLHLRQLLDETPNRRIWLVLMILSVASYLVAPISQLYLTDPIRVVYQLYRYSLRELLFVPLVALIIADRRRLKSLLTWLVAAINVSALISIPQGYQGLRTGGLFDANSVGSAYSLAFLACLAALVLFERRLPRLLAFFSILVLLRGLLFSASRGSFVTILAATAVFGVGLFSWSGSRTKALRFGVAGLLGLVAVLIVKPEIGARPTIQRFVTIMEPTEQATFRWRYQERWPYFWNLALEHPWLGQGTSADERLGETGNTPHNGYLAVAVERGLPFIVGMVMLGIMGIRRALKSFRYSSETPTKVSSLVVLAGIIAILVHNIVESTFVVPFVARSYWVCIALSYVIERLRLEQPQATPGSLRSVAAAEPDRTEWGEVVLR